MATNQKRIKDDMIRWFEAFAARDVNRMDQLADEIYDSTYVLHDPSFPNFEQGPAGIKQLVRQVFKGFSDLHVTVDDMLGEGDKLAVRLTARGTSATTGKVVHFPVLTVARYVGDKMVEEWQLTGAPEEE